MRNKMGVLFVLLSVAASTGEAQRARRPNYGQMYCSGAFSTESVSHDTYMISGEESAIRSTFQQGDYVYINKGDSQGVKVGDEFLVTRPVKDPTAMDYAMGRPQFFQVPIKWFDSEPSLRRAMGTYWKDVGRLRVVVAQADVSIAQVVFSCDYLQRGDYLHAFAERPAPLLKPGGKFDQFAPPSGRPKAMVAASEAAVVGTNDIIYVNLGSGQGVNVGDYFRVFRYQGTRHDTAYQHAGMAHKMWGFGGAPRGYGWDDLPREVLGEGVVLRTTENSSTVLLTYALREMFLGDYVELEIPEPIVEEVIPPPPPAPANRPPSMTCAVDRSPVPAGERVRISARASDPDGDPLTYTWSTTAGELIGSGPSVMLDTTGLRPGSVTVSASVSDGRTGTADCAVEVVVQPVEAPPQASKINECFFRYGSAAVDNVCKRILDDMATRLKNDPMARLVVVGYADPEEVEPGRLAAQRAENAKQYLLASGIAGERVDARSASGQAGAGRENRRVDFIWVPAGATY